MPKKPREQNVNLQSSLRGMAIVVLSAISFIAALEILIALTRLLVG